MTLFTAVLTLLTQLFTFGSIGSPLASDPGQENDLRNPENQQLFHEEDMMPSKKHCPGKG